MHIDFPPVDARIEGMERIHTPPMYLVRQKYDDAHIDDIRAHVLGQLRSFPDRDALRGKRLCVTAGSRGVPGMREMYRAVVDGLKELGAEPFIVPAMGSHGGATAEGQLEVLAAYGITPQTMDAPVLSSMEVVEYGRLEGGLPLYCDRYAAAADGIVLMHKVKPHTDFRGRHESGLAKMIAIGLGKHKGASAFHTLGFAHFARRIPECAQIFLERFPVVMGIGFVQNAYDRINRLEIVPGDGIMDMDARLLEIAKAHIARFKADNLDVLILDQIGKNVSGFGFDPNIVGRTNGLQADFADILDLKKLVILGMTEESHHNASGLAAADLTTRRLLNEVDWSSTWTNLITSTRVKGGSIPMYMNDDRQAILLAIRTCEGIDPDRVRLARVRNTLEMGVMEMSEALVRSLNGRPDVEILEGPYPMTFDETGRIAPIRKEH